MNPMTGSNNTLRLPLDPFLYNSTEWWWRNNHELYKGNDVIYRAYQVWMQEQGVILRDANTTETGIEFVDEVSMTMFILRWSN